MNRRDFMIGCGAGAALLATSNLRVLGAPFGLNAVNDDHIFVVVFLRGGCDGLQLVGPSSNRIYNDSRSINLKTTERGPQKGYLLENSLDDIGFRFHYNASELNELYKAGDLAVLHACGLTNGTRSHFVAQDLVERGISLNGKADSGWMARYLNEINAQGIITGAATNGTLPVSLAGASKATSVGKLKDFKLQETIRHHELMRQWYNGDSKLDQTARKAIEAVEFVKANAGKYSAQASYPSAAKTAELNNSFQSLAGLIKMNAGVRIANIDFGGWDTHENQNQYFPTLVKALSKSLYAFYQDIKDYRSKTTILVMSEFGRRLRSNNSAGTDHGYGNMMMALGGGVKGGHMYGKWPGLEPGQLDRRVDLGITTDYRDVLSEILSHQGFKGDIFPDYEYKQKLGLFG
jgi:uncharacterized protein (DUF1501 family)